MELINEYVKHFFVEIVFIILNLLDYCLTLYGIVFDNMVEGNDLIDHLNLTGLFMLKLSTLLVMFVFRMICNVKSEYMSLYYWVMKTSCVIISFVVVRNVYLLWRF